MGTGTLEARVRVTISPKIAGRIEQLLADQGDRVRKGDTLVKLDNEELVQQVEVAQATLAASQAAVERLKTDRDRAVAVSEQATREHRRQEQLVSQSASSQADFDKAVEAMAIAQAGVARAEAAIIEGEQQVLATERTLAYERARLADTEIIAPFDGLIVRRQRDPGDVVVPGSPILQLVSLEQLWISAWVDDTEMARLEVGQPARVVFRSEPDHPYPGKVARLGKEADRETREFVVDVEVLDLPGNWAVGQRAEVYIETDRKDNVTLIPTSHVQWRGDTPGVFALSQQRAIWKPLEFGLRSFNQLEVVKGLSPGDTVITAKDPKAKLADGKRVVQP
jgi:HlyD family secretion protein